MKKLYLLTIALLAAAGNVLAMHQKYPLLSPSHLLEQEKEKQLQCLEADIDKAAQNATQELFNTDMNNIEKAIGGKGLKQFNGDPSCPGMYGDESKISIAHFLLQNFNEVISDKPMYTLYPSKLRDFLAGCYPTSHNIKELYIFLEQPDNQLNPDYTLKTAIDQIVRNHTAGMDPDIAASLIRKTTASNIARLVQGAASAYCKNWKNTVYKELTQQYQNHHQ